MAALAAYLSEAAGAVSRQDGAALAALLAVDAPRPLAAVVACLREAPRTELGALASARLPPPYDEVLALHCQCLAALAQNKMDDAYAACCLCLSAFTRDFRASEAVWPIPLLAQLTRTLRLTAQHSSSKLTDAGSQLMKCFPATYLASSREKRLATLQVVNAAFKIYFRLNTLRLCKNMIASVESRNALPFDEYSVSQKVTYKFYTGRLAVFDEDYCKAEKDLSYAFTHCHASAVKNQGRVLRYLVPVKLLLGHLPSPALLARFPDLACYAPVATAVRTGDVRALNAALDDGQEEFIRAGTYLLLEKLKAGVYRTLLKRIHAMQREREPAKAFQLHISLFQRALSWLGVDMDLDECECVLANLIYRKYVKGYLSHKARVVVLSKASPFPKLSTVSFDEPA